jgi:hypothetical protein
LTVEELAWSVVQVMVAEVDVILPLATAEMTGAAAVVAKVKLADVVDAFELFAEIAA